MILPSSMADFVPYDCLFQKAYYFDFGFTTVWDWLSGSWRVIGLGLVLQHSIENRSTTVGLAFRWREI